MEARGDWPVMSHRTYVTITLGDGMGQHMLPEQEGSFPFGVLSLTGGAVNLAATYGLPYYMESFRMHLRGECACGNPEHTAEIQGDIAEGRPVLTVRGPSIEPASYLVFYTNAERTRTIVCTGTENYLDVMADVEALKPERFAEE